MALRSYFRKTIWSKLHGIIAIIGTIAFIALMLMPVRTGGNDLIHVAMWTVYVLISIYLPKYIFVVFDILSRIPMLFKGRQSKAVNIVGTLIGALLFVAMWWGALVNRFDYQVKDVVVTDENLPAAFNNYSIVQISDLHLGTYNDTTYISRVVDKVNALKPDLILFTGDIVNRNTAELKPFVKVLSRLHAKQGVYSILGNHDYGDYEDWSSPKEKAENMQLLKDLQAKMGWTMLNNAHQALTVGSDTIMLIGVENIGDAPFPTYGNLTEAYPNVGDKHFKILMSHNPAHWTSAIKDNENCNIALTLAGHTHAMQIEAFGVSPAYFRYRTWGGTYNDELNHRLYVNIGIGTVGFPARIGATPEITHFTLKR
jgi:predicted MPP superfamily phosphohydrolase